VNVEIALRSCNFVRVHLINSTTKYIPQVANTKQKLERAKHGQKQNFLRCGWPEKMSGRRPSHLLLPFGCPACAQDSVLCLRPHRKLASASACMCLQTCSAQHWRLDWTRTTWKEQGQTTPRSDLDFLILTTAGCFICLKNKASASTSA
jgi:hypothetical protein